MISTEHDIQISCVRQGVGYALLDDFGLIEITGPDAASFLHSQTTNDVNRLQPGQGQASALLDRKGHIQAYFSLHRLENKYWLLLETTQIPTVLERLEMYHFSEKLEITDRSSDFVLYTLQGPKAKRLLDRGGLQAEYAITQAVLWEQPMTVIQLSLTGEDGFILVIDRNQTEALQHNLVKAGQSFNLAEITKPMMEVLRIEAGIPRFGVDMDSGTLLPATGLERFAVSYNKGCYLGQEVVAKVKTYGSVQKALVGLIFQADETLPPLGTACFIDDKQVGVLKSSTYSPTLQSPIGLAYLDRDYRVPNKQLTLVVNNHPYPVTVALLPFYTPAQASERARQKYENGLRLFAENREEQAIQQLREALELDPNLPDAYESLGVMLSRQEEYDEAITLMQKLTEIDPDSVMAHTNLSMFYMKKGMKEEAEIEKAKATTLAFQKAMTLAQQKKSEDEARQAKQKPLEEKVHMFQEVLALDAEDALANYGLGNTYNELQQYAAAVPLLEKAISLDPKYTVAYLALGKAYTHLKHSAKARIAFEKGIEVASKRGDLMPLQEMQRYLASLPSE